MKTITAGIIWFLLMIIISCDSNDGNNDLICSVQKMEDRFASTGCIAEELVTGCANIECGTVGGPTIGSGDISVGRFGERCAVIDCETLECDPIVVGSSSFVTGILTNLVINDINGLPEGIFVIEGFDDTPFECIFLSVN